MTIFTTPIYYVNSKPHLGHAYTTLAADVLSRATKGQLVTGTDEHGGKIAEAAAKEQRSPQEFANSTSALFQELLAKLNTNADEFIRTTDEDHKELVQQLLTKLFNKNLIKRKEWIGNYCLGCESYLSTRQAPDGICPDHRRKLTSKKEFVYVLEIEPYREALKEHLINNPNWISPKERVPELDEWLSPELPDLVLSRSDTTWGIPLPWDKSEVAYVWVDALCNYLTAIKRHSNWHWNDGVVHILGKDILRHHALLWPCLLFALDLPLPKQLLVHGHLTIEGSKISKSGQQADPLDAWLEVAGHPDILRTYLFTEVGFGRDGNVSLEDLSIHRKRHTGQWGNLIHRTASLAWKYFPNQPLPTSSSSISQQIINKTRTELKKHYTNAELSKAQQTLWNAIGEINARVNELEPWNNPSEEIIGELWHAVVALKDLIEPFTPGATETFNQWIDSNQCLNQEPKIIYPKAFQKLNA